MQPERSSGKKLERRLCYHPLDLYSYRQIPENVITLALITLNPLFPTPGGGGLFILSTFKGSL